MAAVILKYYNAVKVFGWRGVVKQLYMVLYIFIIFKISPFPL